MLSSAPRFFCLLAVLASLLSGCATTSILPEHGSAPAVEAASDLSSPLVPVVRYGRYTLVELAPSAAQQDLLLQAIDVAIPDTLHATVGDALQHVLLRSGYRLCDVHDAAALLALPLPASHYQMDPVLLRDALLALTGPGWDLSVDDGTRHICISQAMGAVSPTQTSQTGADDHTTPISLAVESQP